MSGFVIRATSLHDDEKIRWVSPGPQNSLWDLGRTRAGAAVFRTEEAATQMADAASKLTSVMNDWRFSVERAD